MDDYYAKNPYAQPDFEGFYTKAPLKKFVDVAPSATVTFQQVSAWLVLQHSDSMSLDYLVQYEEKGRKKELPIQIVMVRECDRQTGDYNWCVESVDSPKIRR